MICQYPIYIRLMLLFFAGKSHVFTITVHHKLQSTTQQSHTQMIPPLLYRITINHLLFCFSIRKRMSGTVHFSIRIKQSQYITFLQSRRQYRYVRFVLSSLCTITINILFLQSLRKCEIKETSVLRIVHFPSLCTMTFNLMFVIYSKKKQYHAQFISLSENVITVYYCESYKNCRVTPP